MIVKGTNCISRGVRRFVQQEPLVKGVTRNSGIPNDRSRYVRLVPASSSMNFNMEGRQDTKTSRNFLKEPLISSELKHRKHRDENGKQRLPEELVEVRSSLHFYQKRLNKTLRRKRYEASLYTRLRPYHMQSLQFTVAHPPLALYNQTCMLLQAAPITHSQQHAAIMNIAHHKRTPPASP